MRGEWLCAVVRVGYCETCGSLILSFTVHVWLTDLLYVPILGNAVECLKSTDMG